jgi:SagB-type dehydrogenase family enzyme
MRRLRPHIGALSVDMAALLEQRQTRRDFSCELSDVELGEFLWLACRSRSSRPSAFGPDQESRPHPSAGAMHPIHVLLARGGEPWARYDPGGHALMEVPGSVSSADAVRKQSQELLSLDRGVVIALVAEAGRTAAKYANADSLVWRDAGVVLGYMSVVAEALALAFCPLGVTGEPHFMGLVPERPDDLQGVGLAIVGGRSTT